MTSRQFNVSWKDHSCTLVSVFENLLKKNTLVDCTLAAEGQYMKAHKMVLSACSSYFELLFSQESEKNPIVILKDVEFQELKAVVNFMYSGEVEVCEDRLEAFSEVAKSLQIRGLQSDGRTQNPKKKSSSLLVEISSAKTAETPQQQSRKDSLRSCNDRADFSANIYADCDLVKRNERLSDRQSSRSESSCSPLALPLSTSFSQRGEDTWGDQDNVEKDQNSSDTFTQFSSGENEQSNIIPVIKAESVSDVYCEEKTEEADTVFGDDVTMIEDQEDWNKHSVETMRDENTTSFQGLVEISSVKTAEIPQQQSRKDLLSSCSDRADLSANISADCDLVKRNERLSDRRSSRSGSSRFPPALPLSTSFSQRGEDTWGDQDNVEKDKSSSDTFTQFSSGENEQSNIIPVIKAESVSDVYCEEKTEEADRVFGDDVTMMEDQEDWNEHNVETMRDENTTSFQGLGFSPEHIKTEDGTSENAERVQSPLEGPEVFVPDVRFNLQPAKSSVSTQQHYRNTTGSHPIVLGTAAESINPAFPPQESQQHEAKERIRVQCQKVFSSSADLEKHKRSHSRKQNRKCPFCDYTATRPSAMTTHLRIHSGSRPYKCPYCTHNSARKHNLEKHIRIHTGETPYQCPECDYKSNDSSSLKRHRRIHTNEKPYQCRYCELRTTVKGTLLRHERRVHS